MPLANRRRIRLLYLRGLGVPKNVAKAKAWFEKAAAAGDTQARQELTRLKALAPPPGKKK